MKLSLSTILSVTICVLLAPHAQANESIELEYSFAPPVVRSVEIGEQQFDRLTIEGCPTGGEVGHPALPGKPLRVLLPCGMDLESIEVIAGGKVLIGRGLRLEPVEEPFAMSAPPEQWSDIRVDRAAYAQTSALPVEKTTAPILQTFHGCRVALITLCPVEYTPATGELFYFPQIKVVVNAAAAAPSASLRGLADDGLAVGAHVDNPAQLTSYASRMSGRRRGYDMLIITPASLATAFQPLRDYHDSTGVATEIHTLEQIGGSDPHTVRDYIRSEYMSGGIRFVLIGGDDDIIPALDLYVSVTVSDGSLTEYAMPGDFYFACLDGTFNYDGDDRYGEPGDGEDGGEIDLLPEIALGRLSVNTVADVNNIVNKTITYLESDGEYLSKVLLSGEQLNFGGLGEYGGYAIDEMISSSDAHGFTTFAFPEDQYQVDKLYDLLSQPNNVWYPSEMISKINGGVHIIDHLGHSNIGYAMRTDTTMIKEQLNNTDYCFIYAEGCLAGSFDHTDCWAEYVTVKLATGASGCVANARIGLGSRSTQHPVHVFNREFWDAIYCADEGRPELGMAMLDARFDIASWISSSAMRWTYYETNLHADPAVAIKPVSSLAIRFPDGTPTSLLPMTETVLDISVTGIGEGLPDVESGLVHCLIDGTDSTTVPLMSPRGELFQATLPAIPCGSRLEYYVSCLTLGGGQCLMPSPDKPLSAIAVSEEVTVFQDDFENDLGWTISGGSWARGVPLGLGGNEQNYPVPDPTEGCNGPNVMGYNLSGNYENSQPAHHITSPPIDCSSSSNTLLRFCRWLGIEQPIYDDAQVSASNNGTDWTVLWQNPAVVADLEWNEVEYDISSVADGQPTVYVRITMGPTDGGLRYCGWNVDDVRVVSQLCEYFHCGDIDANDVGPDIADLIYLVTFMFQDGPMPPATSVCDVDGNGSEPDIADLVYLVTFMFQDGPALKCGF